MQTEAWHIQELEENTFEILQKEIRGIGKYDGNKPNSQESTIMLKQRSTCGRWMDGVKLGKNLMVQADTMPQRERTLRGRS